jgi:methyl-accepting chemotaxis protein
MRFAKLLRLPFARLLYVMSVRTRIIVLAVIPPVGFLANGITFMSSEGEVSAAFQAVKHSAALADASRDFKSAIAEMRISVKDFSAAPKEELIKTFKVAGTVGQQSAAVASITEGVNRASGEARTGAEAMGRVSRVTADVRATAADVKGLADSVAVEAESHEAEVRQFLTNVQAA